MTEQARDTGGLREAVQRFIEAWDAEHPSSSDHLACAAEAMPRLRAALSQGAAHWTRATAKGTTVSVDEWDRPLYAAHEERGLDAAGGDSISYWQARALAAEAHEERGLDEARLAEAIFRVGIGYRQRDTATIAARIANSQDGAKASGEFAEAVAAEYARLATPEAAPDYLAAKDRSSSEHSDTRSECPNCGEWRDSPTADCAACGATPEAAPEEGTP